MAVAPKQFMTIQDAFQAPVVPDLNKPGHDSEEVSTSITQTWTDQAIKCYVTKADCNNCVIPRGSYSFACQMHKVVPVLLKTLGAPDTRRVEKLSPYMYT